MADEHDKLQARRLYVESEEFQSDVAIAKACSINRATVKRWREASSWDVQRAEHWRRCSTDAAIQVQAAASSIRAAAFILTRVRGLEILADIAEKEEEKSAVRIQAIKAAADIDGWTITHAPPVIPGSPIDQDPQPTQKPVKEPRTPSESRQAYRDRLG